MVAATAPSRGSPMFCHEWNFCIISDTTNRDRNGVRCEMMTCDLFSNSQILLRLIGLLTLAAVVLSLGRKRDGHCTFAI